MKEIDNALSKIKNKAVVCFFSGRKNVYDEI